MSSGRMLSKAISISEKVDNLKTAEAKLFYTWAIPHTDDFGLLPVSSKKLQAVVCPLWERPKVEEWAKDIVGQRLWQRVKLHDEDFYFVLNFFGHQTLRRDINPKLWSNRDAKWEDFEQVRNQVDGNLFASIGQRSEAPPQEKRRRSAGSVDEVRKEIYAHERFEGLKKKYPYRNYDEVIEDMCEWWLTKKRRLPTVPILAFKNWLSKTKPDELLAGEADKEERARKTDDYVKKVASTPKPSKKTLDKLKEQKNKLLSKIGI